MKRIIFIATIFFISSCSSNTKSTWSCPILEGGKGSCVSIKDADLSLNESVKNNNSSNGFFNSNQKININLIAPKLKDLQKIKQLENNDSFIKQRQTSLRTEEKVGKIWFAPYIDSEGYQHSEKVILVVDEEAKWVGQK
jgi:type IV conjugative transfer system lipoprotein TraV